MSISFLCVVYAMIFYVTFSALDYWSFTDSNVVITKIKEYSDGIFTHPRGKKILIKL